MKTIWYWILLIQMFNNLLIGISYVSDMPDEIIGLFILMSFLLSLFMLVIVSTIDDKSKVYHEVKDRYEQAIIEFNSSRDKLIRKLLELD